VSRPSPLNIWAVFTRHLITMKRTPLGQSDLWVWPILDVLLFGSVGIYLATSGSELQQQSVLLGVFMYVLVQVSSLSLSILFMDETRSSNILNLIASPITIVDYLLGTLAAGLVRVLISTVAVVVATIVMFDFNPLSAGWGLLVIAPLILIVGYTTSMFLMALQLHMGWSAENLTWVIAIVPASIAGAFFPIESLPNFLQPIARLLPVSNAFEAGRLLLQTGEMPWHEIGNAAVGAAATVALGVALTSWSLRKFREKGLVTRYS
jgi:ABC-2 type transport system permease protein